MATKLSSREFNQDVTKAKRAAANGPVFITDRGHPAHVLLTIDEYLRISGNEPSIVELLTMPEAAAIELEPARVTASSVQPADLSA
jgi:PHD/YefM family antitoxin component YafN of YafNO toxin-antitoxin module